MLIFHVFIFKKSINVSRIFFIVLSFLFISTIICNAEVETGWPVGTPNECKNVTDFFINFERGIEANEVDSSNLNVEFTNTGGLNWLYADFTTGNYNPSYRMNGDFTTWLGVTGDSGRLSFPGGTGSYVSLLTKTYSGLQIDAYDEDGNLLATSGRASSNTGVDTLTRLTVEAEGIAYVEIHDSGNFWTVDDICTDAKPVCQPVPGYENGDSTKRIDLVFVMDADYDNKVDDFLEHIESKIDNRLGGVTPIQGNLDKFNFYYSELEGDASTNTCGLESTLPDNLLDQCPFADAVVVLHTDQFGDCLRWNGSVGIYSAEGNTDRSFIHESGHGLFRLKDEYDSSTCRTNYRGGATPFNIWDTEENCQAAAEGETWVADQCYKFTDCQDDWWKLGDSSIEDDDDKYNDENFKFIMVDGDWFDNGFGQAAEKRINWVFDQVENPASAGTGAASSEKSIAIKMNISGSGIYEIDKKYVISSAPNYIPGDYTYSAFIFSNDGALIGEYGFSDPLLVEAESDYEGPLSIEETDFTLVVPYYSSVENMEIINVKTGEYLLDIDLSDFASTQSREGDLDGNGIIDRNDVSVIRSYLNELSSVCPACDIDDDGSITILDARKIVLLCDYPRCATN